MKSESIILALGYSLIFVAIFAIAEIVIRRTKISPDISRRFIHVISGLFSLVIWNTFSPFIFYVCGGTLLILITLSHYKQLLKSVHSVRRKTYGAQCLPIGILATYALAADTPEIFVPSILIMTFADALAGIIGDMRGKQRPSKLGSIAFFVASLIVLIPYANLFTALAVGFSATIVEKISPYGTDNMTIPITVALLLNL